MKTFKLSAVAMAVLTSGLANAVDYTLYNGPTKNIQRTKGYVTQEEYDSGSNKYPDDSYGSVVYSVTSLQDDLDKLNRPHETLIDLRPFLLGNKSKNLEIANGTTLTLDNSYPSSALINVGGDAKLKFHNGNIFIGKAFRKDNEDDSNTAFNIEYQAEVDLNNVNITSTSEDGANAFLLYGSKNAQYNNSTVNISYTNINSEFDDGLFVFKLEESKMRSDNITANVVGNGGVHIYVLTEDSELDLSNSRLSLEGNNRNGFYPMVFRSVQSTINLDNVTITPKGETVIFGDFYGDEKSNVQKVTQVNMKNSNITSVGKALIGLNDIPENEETRVAYISPFHLNSDNTTLRGGIIQFNNAHTTPVTINLINGSQWLDIGSTIITNLHNENSVVDLSSSNSFDTLTINGNLTGSGTFKLNTDLANQQSDQVVVTGNAEGSHKLDVKDSGNEPNVANGKVTLVKIQAGNADFSLLNRDYVDAGAYRYRLVKQGNDWLLSNKDAERSGTPPTNDSANNESNSNTVAPTTPNKNTNVNTNTNTVVSTTPNVNANVNTSTNTVIPNTQSMPTAPTEQLVLSEKSNALVSLRQAQLALVESSLEGLHHRLGELKNGEKGNMWVRNVNTRNNFASTHTADNSTSSGFKQNIHTVQIGADTTLTPSIRLGGFVGNAGSDVDFNGEYGSGKVKSQSVGIYSTYLADNGFYMDNIAKYERVKSEADSTGKQKYNAYTLSSEIGKIYQFSQNWTATPQLQIAWTKFSGYDDEDRLSAFTARAGVRVGKILMLHDWKLQPYAELNAITTKTNNNSIQVNQYQFDIAESRERFQTALGVNALFGNHRLGLEGSVTNGKRLDQPYKIQAVYRYNW